MAQVHEVFFSFANPSPLSRLLRLRARDFPKGKTQDPRIRAGATGASSGSFSASPHSASCPLRSAPCASLPFLRNSVLSAEGLPGPHPTPPHPRPVRKINTVDTTCNFYLKLFPRLQITVLPMQQVPPKRYHYRLTVMCRIRIKA